MLEQLMQQVTQSETGAQLLSQLKGMGLNENQAQGALGATAEGMLSQLGGGSGGVGGLLQGLGSMAGGSGGLGNLAGALGGALGGQGLAGMNLQSLVQPVTQFVVQKTGLDANLAQTVVNAVLPKLVELVSKPSAVGQTAAPAGGLGGMIGSFLK